MRLWKLELQKLADETGLAIQVRHYPPGTSKWNKIEHRMFCHITQNWRGRPLTDRAHRGRPDRARRPPKTGLKVESALDTRSYDKGIKVSNAEMEAPRHHAAIDVPSRMELHHQSSDPGTYVAVIVRNVLTAPLPPRVAYADAQPTNGENLVNAAKSGEQSLLDQERRCGASKPPKRAGAMTYAQTRVHRASARLEATAEATNRMPRTPSSIPGTSRQAGSAERPPRRAAICSARSQ